MTLSFSSEQMVSSKRVIGIGLVIALHIGLAYGLLNGMQKAPARSAIEPVQVAILEERRPPPSPPQPKAAPEVKPSPMPSKPQPAPVVRPPQTTPTVTLPVASASATAVATSVPPAPTAAPSAPSVDKGPSRTAAVVDPSKCGKPPYPSASQRNEEEGVVTLAFLIGVDGTVLDAKVQKSSGYPELDKAARDGLSLCKFKPATVDGAPEQSWTKMQYVWKLQ
ncbi:energy transducer TonB [Herbaspirillum sp. B65]|uniref:energy transducer TonB n=1 Tax=Herbaspirillum sp. B65 TaxID=137708 RepID=UPI00209123C3|nr:energy transducer TonB [Herbaspirillum sp. B65]